MVFPPMATMYELAGMSAGVVESVTPCPGSNPVELVRVMAVVGFWALAPVRDWLARVVVEAVLRPSSWKVPPLSVRVSAGLTGLVRALGPATMTALALLL